MIYNNASKMELKTSGVLSRLADMETRGKLRKARELKQFITNRLNGLSGDAPACLDIVFALAVGYRLRHLDAEEREILTCVYPLLVHTPVAGLAAPKTYMKFVDCTSEMMEMKCFSDTEQVLTYIIDHTQDFDTAQFRLRPAYEHLLLCYQRQANVSAIDKLADKVLSLTIDRSNKDNCLFLVGVLLVREEMFEHDARFDQAKACLEEAQSLTSRTGSKQHQVWCHLIDGRLKLEMNKLNEAEVSLNAANSVLARLKLPKVVELTWKLRIYSKLVKAYSLQHKRQLCVFYMKAYLDIGRQLPEYRKAVLKQGIKVYTEIGDLTAAKKLQKELTDTQYSTPAH